MNIVNLSRSDRASEFVVSPLGYFGNRGLHQQDFFKVITAYQAECNREKFNCCYDLFSGSGSLGLYALQLGIAKSYVFNDAFKPLAFFWNMVKNSPTELATIYEEHIQHYLDKGASYFNQQQTLLNDYIQVGLEKLAPIDLPKATACFAFIINHAKAGQPLCAGKGEEQLLVCQVEDKPTLNEYDSEFKKRVHALHELFSQDNVHFTHQDFTKFDIKADDIALLDPPYPDMSDAEQEEMQHIYLRTENKNTLSQRLLEAIQAWERQAIPFVMFYGVLGLNNSVPISWPKGHVLRLSGTPQGPFGEYIEHLYLSFALAAQLVYPVKFIDGQPSYLTDDPSLQGKIQPLFYRLVEIQAQGIGHVNSERPAVVWEENNEVKQLSYYQLNQAANRLAHSLRYCGAERGTLVAIYLPRGPQLIAALLGVMKSGAAYLPLESHLERQSIKTIILQLQLSEASCLITTPELAKALHYASGKAISLPCLQPQGLLTINSDDLDFSIFARDLLHRKKASTTVEQHLQDWTKNLGINIRGEDLAYVMFTSGSTGVPKGVEITQRGLTYAYTSHQDILNLNPNDRVLQFGSLAFDASLMEILMALGTGASLYCIENGIFNDVQRLASFMERHQITVAIQTPKQLETIPADKLEWLRAVLIVGDKFERALANRWLSLIKINTENKTVTKRRQVINGYGLTETTICTTLEDLQPSENKSLSIGQPILGLQVQLRDVINVEAERERLDNPLQSESIIWLKANETDKVGELITAGPCVARGYWKQQSLSQQRFSKITMNKRTVWAYRTGDACEYNQQQDLMIVGRLDRQVKIRGQRLELSSVEQALGQHKLVAKDSFNKGLVRVNALKDETTHKQFLIAFIVPANKNLAMKIGQAASENSRDAIKQIINESLTGHPNFYRPALINTLLVEALPYKTNDKQSVDDAALKAIYPFNCFPNKDDLLPREFPADEQTDLSDLRQFTAELLGFRPTELAWRDELIATCGMDSVTINRFISGLKAKTFKTKWLEEVKMNFTAQVLHDHPSLWDLWQYAYQQYLAKQKQRQELSFIMSQPELPEYNKLMLKEIGLYQGKLFQKIELPFYAIHSILGNADLDYQNCCLAQLPCSYHPINFPMVPLPTSLTELVEIHLKHIRNRHSKGPYWLLGWSSGGLIALLMAKQLREQGERVFTFLLDTEHPRLLQSKISALFAKDLENLAAKLCKSLISILGDSEWLSDNSQWSASTAVPTQEKAVIIKTFFADLRQVWEIQQANYSDKQKQEVERILYTCELMLQQELQYHTELIPALQKDDSLFIACSSQGQDKQLGWRGDGNYFFLDTDHFNLLHLADTQKLLEQQLIATLTQVKTFQYQGLAALLSDSLQKAIYYLNQAIEQVPNYSLLYSYRGTANVRLSQFDKAVADYNKAIDLNPNHANTYFNRGTIYLTLGQHEAAVADFDQAIKLDPKDAKAYHNRGGAKARLGQYKEAFADFDQAVELKANIDTYFMRGFARFLLGQYVAAIKDIDTALQLNPKDADIHYLRGITNTQLGQYQLAIADYDKAIELNPQNYRSYLSRSHAYEKLCQYKFAIDDLNVVIKLNPKQVDAYFNRGVAYAFLGQCEIAIEDYDKALDLAPKHLHAYICRGYAKVKLAQYKTAIEDFNQAIELNPNSADIYNTRGELNNTLGQYKAALEDFHKAIILNPKDARAFFNRGTAKTQLGQYKAALEDFNEAIVLNPKDISAYSNRGCAHFNLGQYEAALTDFNKAIDLDPNYADAYNNRGRAKIEQGQFEVAIIDFDVAIRLNPNYAYAYNNRGYAKIKQGQYEEAVIDFDIAIRLNPNYTKAYFNRGNANYALGRVKKTIGDWKQTVKLYPNSAQILHNLGCLLHVQAQRKKLKHNSQKYHICLKEADSYFKQAMKIASHADIYTDYAQFMLLNLSHYTISQIVDVLNQAIQFNEPTKYLNYDLTKSMTLDIKLQGLINEHQNIALSAHLLAHYLLIQAYILDKQYDKAKDIFSTFTRETNQLKISTTDTKDRQLMDELVQIAEQFIQTPDCIQTIHEDDDNAKVASITTSYPSFFAHTVTQIKENDEADSKPVIAPNL